MADGDDIDQSGTNFKILFGQNINSYDQPKVYFSIYLRVVTEVCKVFYSRISNPNYRWEVNE